MSNEKVVVEFQGKDQLTPTLNSMGGSLKAFSTAIKSVAAIFLVGEFAQALKYTITESAESERVFKNLENTLKNVKGTSKDTAVQVDALSKSLSAMSGFTDEDLNSAFTRLVQITQDVGLSTNALKIAMDFARGSGQDLMSASESLGRALEGNTRGLRQYGIMIKEGATETEILEAVQQRFAGSSAVYAQTLTGEWEKLKTTFTNMAEEIGNKLQPRLAMILAEVNKALNPSSKLPEIFAQVEQSMGKLTVTEKQAAEYAKMLFERDGLGALNNPDYLHGIEVIEGGLKRIADSAGKAKTSVEEYDTVFTQMAASGSETPLTKAKKEWEELNATVQKSLNFYPTAINLTKSLGAAIGATAAGSTTAWKDFAVNALTSVINFAENAIEAQMAVMLASGNIPGVVLGAAGLVGLEAIKAGVQTATSSSATSTDTSTSTGTTSSGGTVSTGATTIAAPASMTLNINLFNPVFMDKESKLQTINDMLNLASANGWNVSRTPSVAMA